MPPTASSAPQPAYQPGPQSAPQAGPRPVAPRLREAAAVALLAFGIMSTVFNGITLLFDPDGCVDTGIGAMQCTGSQGPTIPFSYRALGATGSLLNPVVIAALVGAVALVHVPTWTRISKAVAVVSLVTVALAGILGMVGLFASFGADRATGYMKTTAFFIGATQLAVTAVAVWLILGYFRQHGPVRAPYSQPPQPGPWNQPPQPQWGPQ